jgi:hypothetical protein
MYFFYSLLMSAALKSGIQPGPDDIDGIRNGSKASCQNQDIGIVVHSAKPGNVCAGAQGGTDGGDFIGCDAHANPTSADQDTQFTFPFRTLEPQDNQ